MSIHEHDEDIDVVSSPEPSPRSRSESQDRLTSTPIHNRSPAFDRTSDDRASFSPAKAESTSSDQEKTSSAAFTSFSINSILSRSESKKDELIGAPFLSNAQLSDPSAAMISRYVSINRISANFCFILINDNVIPNHTHTKKKKSLNKHDSRYIRLI